MEQVASGKGCKMTIESMGVLIGLISAVVAGISTVFAWRAVKLAERSNTIELMVELHQLYHSAATFRATQRVWELYQEYPESMDGEPISHQEALRFVFGTDRKSGEWEAVHNASSFWRYVRVLVDGGFIDEDVAFEAFMSPGILGFLYPIERAFLGKSYNYDRSLQRLYERWKSRKGEA